LKKILSELRPEGFGLIARTESEEKSPRDFKNDVRRLERTWKQISKNAEKKDAPALLHQELDITGSLMRDVFSEDIERLVVDDRKMYRSILSYLKEVDPALRSKIERYGGDVPIFDVYGIEAEIEKLFEHKIWLKRGSFLVIDQTEAMVTIDVNTGRFVGKKSQEETILHANLEAAREVARQIRLRDIGGLIIIDFIDMMHFANRRRVYEEFKDAFRHDRAKHSISPISEFGLIEMTRQRVRPSLTQSLSDPCPICHGRGRVLSKETLGLKLERWFARARIATDIRSFRLVTHSGFAEYLTDPKEKRLEKIAKSQKVKIELDGRENLAPDKYQIFSTIDGVELTEMFAPRPGAAPNL
jgi:ribonuclease G